MNTGRFKTKMELFESENIFGQKNKQTKMISWSQPYKRSYKTRVRPYKRSRILFVC